MPFAARAIPALLEALDKNNVALLGDDDGTHQFLVSAWNRQTLITATSATQPGDLRFSSPTSIPSSYAIKPTQPSTSIPKKTLLPRERSYTVKRRLSREAK